MQSHVPTNKHWPGGITAEHKITVIILNPNKHPHKPNR